MNLEKRDCKGGMVLNVIEITKGYSVKYSKGKHCLDKEEVVNFVECS